jgi:hypothetical protein
MTIRSAVATLLGCTLLLAALGAMAGFALGTLAPDYYRTVFLHGREPGFDPISVGIGQGLTQGAVGGAVAALVIVALLCWREIRLRRVDEPPAADEPVGSGTTASRILIIVGSILVLGLCLGAVLLGGLLAGERGAYHRRFLEEQQALAPVLVGDPAFAGVELYETSRGAASLTGEVPTTADLRRLREAVVRAVGEPRANKVMRGVGAKDK